MRPIENVNVRIYQKKQDTITFEDFFLTDCHGKTMDIPLYAPDPLASLQEQTTTCPYELYHLELRKAGFQTQLIENVQLFAQHSTLCISLLPGELKQHCSLSYSLAQRTNYKDIVWLIPSWDFSRTVSIPQLIQVPESSTKKLCELSFLDYLRYAASILLYPTWPYEAQKALLWMLITRMLHAVDEESMLPLPLDYQHFQNQYVITNHIIDELFPTWLTSYCHKQETSFNRWDVVAKSIQGETALAIIQQLYGEVTIQRDQAYLQNDHKWQQAALSRCAKHLPALQSAMQSQDPAIWILAFQKQYALKMSGHLNAATLVKLRQVDLTGQYLDQLAFLPQDSSPPIRPFDDHDIERWKQLLILYLHCYLRCIRLSKDTHTLYELLTSYLDGPFTSEQLGRANWDELINFYHTFLSMWKPERPSPPTLLSDLGLHAKGQQVLLLQTMLNQLSSYYPAIPVVVCDGQFGVRSEQAVSHVQHIFQLNVSGIVDTMTWDTLYQAVHSLTKGDNHLQDLPFYSPTPSTGITRTDILLVQECLSAISKAYPSIPIIQIDGVFGERTRQAIISFQQLLGLPADGICDRMTMTQLQQLKEELYEKKM